MSKPKPIQINIPNPCSQSWDEMTPTAQGRFCGQCQKTVIDFTTWSDAALYNFLSQKSGRVCGRYLATQLNRPINIPYQPHSKLYGIAIAVGFTLAFAQTPHLLAQNRPPLITQTHASQKPTEKQFGTISGRVFDERKEPMINAGVQVFLNGVLAGGTITDYDGNYIIKPLETGNYEVLARYSGYDSIRVTHVIVTDNQANIQDFEMVKQHGSQPREIVITAYRKPLYPPAEKQTITAQELMRVGGGDVSDLVGLSPSIYQSQRGKSVLPDIPHADTVKLEKLNHPLLRKSNKEGTINLDIDNPTKQTFTREDIDHKPN